MSLAPRQAPIGDHDAWWSTSDPDAPLRSACRASRPRRQFRPSPGESQNPLASNGSIRRNDDDSAPAVVYRQLPEASRLPVPCCRGCATAARSHSPERPASQESRAVGLPRRNDDATCRQRFMRGFRHFVCQHDPRERSLLCISRPPPAGDPCSCRQARRSRLPSEEDPLSSESVRPA